MDKRKRGASDNISRNPQETLKRYEDARRRGAYAKAKSARRRNRKSIGIRLRRGVLPVALALGSLGHFVHYFFRQHFSSTLSKGILGGLALVTACAVVIAAWLLTADNALEVSIDGAPIGFVAMEADIDEQSLTEQVSNTIAVTVGANIVLGQAITLEPMRAPQDEIMSRPEMVSALRDELSFLAEGFAVVVEGTDMGILRSQEVAEDLLQRLLREFAPEGVQMAFSPEFVEHVEIERRELAPEFLEVPDTVFARLHQMRAMNDQHRVESGDNLSIIASRFDMSLDELRAVNPGISDVLSVGQMVNVVHNTPFLSVRTVEVYTETAPEPFRTETIENESQLTTFRRVIQEGQEGSKEVTYHITRINGIEDSRSIVSENVFEAPIHEIVEVGTREHPHLRD